MPIGFDIQDQWTWYTWGSGIIRRVSSVLPARTRILDSAGHSIPTATVSLPAKSGCIRINHVFIAF